MRITVKQLAEILHGTVEGDGEIFITKPSKIEEGGEGSISFLANAKYEPYAYSTTASALLVNRDFKPAKPISASLIRVEDVYAAVAILFEKFGNTIQNNGHINEKAAIHETTSIGQNVSIDAFSVIKEEVNIGDNTVIFPQVYIGKHTKIGNNVIIHAGVKIYHDTVIGNNCIIHANTVIGSDGFGFAPLEDGTFKKINQIGNVIIEDDVEIGANTVIDRASLGSTIIRSGVKLDNLIQVAHSVEIGKNTVIAAQTGIAGSTKIGENNQIGGQVGIVGHIKTANGVKVQAQSGIASTITEENIALSGSPAIPYSVFMRAAIIFKQLPELSRRVTALEHQTKKDKV